MTDLRRALDTGSDYDLDEYLGMVGPEQFRAEVEELAQPSATLRDQFAMAALRGLVTRLYSCDQQPLKIAAHCYEMADAMLKARAGQEGSHD